MMLRCCRCPAGRCAGSPSSAGSPTCQHRRPRLLRRARPDVVTAAGRAARRAATWTIVTAELRRPRRGRAAAADAAVVVVGYTAAGRGRVRRLVRRRAGRALSAGGGPDALDELARVWEAGRSRVGGDRDSLRLHPRGRGADPRGGGGQPAHGRRGRGRRARSSWRSGGTTCRRSCWPGTRAWRAANALADVLLGDGRAGRPAARSPSRATRPTCRRSTKTPPVSSTTAGTAQRLLDRDGEVRRRTRSGFGLSYTTLHRDRRGGGLRCRDAPRSGGSREHRQPTGQPHCAGIRHSTRVGREIPCRLRQNEPGTRCAGNGKVRGSPRATGEVERTWPMAASDRRVPHRGWCSRGRSGLRSQPWSSCSGQVGTGMRRRPIAISARRWGCPARTTAHHAQRTDPLGLPLPVSVASRHGISLSRQVGSRKFRRSSTETG